MSKNSGIITVIIIATLFFNRCAENTKNETKTKVEEKTSTENFDWLLGNWKRNFEEKGKETFEIWTKNSNSEYSGIGFTMQNKDTLKQEKIRLIKSNGKWVLEVQPQGEPVPIVFNMTRYNNKMFICENKELDFPKRIKYWKNGDKINALVSGNEMDIPFEFERIEVNP